MSTAFSRVGWTVGLMSVSVAASAQTPRSTPPQEPAGFIAGGVIGGLALGPVGAVVGAGVGTWLGNRVRRADEAKKAEAHVAALEADALKLARDTRQLETEKAALEIETGDLRETNRALTARLDELSQRVEAVQDAVDGAQGDEAARVLDGLQGDVLFRSGSAEVSPQMIEDIEALAQAAARSPVLKVRVDGYADPRGTAQANLELSAARAAAVGQLFIAAGVSAAALEVNAYGKSRSLAADSDGYALERRVRLTLQAADAPAGAKPGGESTSADAATALTARGSE